MVDQNLFDKQKKIGLLRQSMAVEERFAESYI